MSRPTLLWAFRDAALLGLAATIACVPPRPAAPTPHASPIDTMTLRAHTAFLASDLLEGRGTGSRGAEVAALYLEAQCRALGLQPLEGGYSQLVPLEQAVPRPGATSFTVGTQAFQVGADFLITGGTPAALQGFRGRPVYVGTADDLRLGTGSLPALAGAVAVVAGVARGDAARVLAERGAVGIVQVVEDSAAYAEQVASQGLTLTVLAAPGVRSSFYPDLPAVVAGPTMVPSLITTLRGRADTVALTADFDRRPIPARNVGCLLPGTDPARRDTVIAFTAHYDHLGVSVPDSVGDTIYNGFSDNAAGVAMLFAIGEALQARPEGGLRHSVLFLFFIAEERGLLGSDFFVARAPFPIERIRVVINLDAGAPPGRPWAWRIAGGEGTPLGMLAIDVAASRGWTATLSAATANSDYFPFARRGVPAVSVIPGSAPYEGLSADSSQALFRRWERYHQARDSYDDRFPFVGLQRYAEYAYRIAEAADVSPALAR
jgi:hypothetical protein